MQARRKVSAIVEVTQVVKRRKVTVPKPGRQRPLSEDRFGLIQEELRDDLYALVIQAILWNQTKGSSARPVLDKILATYPAPGVLAGAPLVELTSIIQPIGLHNRRAMRLIQMAKAWNGSPPCKERRYRKMGYPYKHSGKEMKPDEVLGEIDPREAYEISHLPGVGAYALDSYRIFHRDRLRGVDKHVEPEWKRVVPLDKELRAWLVWRWDKEGFRYDIETGRRTPLNTSSQN